MIRSNRSWDLRGLLVLAGALLVSPMTPQPTYAIWPQFGRALTTDLGDQASPVIAADGLGGGIVAWVDRRSPIVNLFAQRVLATGEVDAAWPPGGRMLLTDPQALANALEPPAFPVIATDGARGAIVVWQQSRNGATSTDIFAQHVLSSGAVDGAWPTNGVVLCAIEGIQDIPEVISDGAGGAIVTWMDGRPGSTVVDVYAQHVLNSGLVDPNWPTNGVAVCTAAGFQAFPKIVEDGAGGAIVTWYDLRSSVTGIDIFAQHVLSSGVVDPAWPVNGTALCTAARNQFNPAIVSDGAGGAIVTWLDARDNTSHIFAQRVLASGSVDPAWPADGSAVCLAPIEQVDPVIASDRAGGAIVAWRDARSFVAHNMFAQHVLASGSVDPAWPIDGTALSLLTTEQSSPAIVSDGGGGALVTWQQDLDIYTQHVLASGLLDGAFPANGLPICTLPSTQQTPAMGGAGSRTVVAWSDQRSGTDFDIFAMQVRAAVAVDVEDTPTSHRIRFAPPNPSPTRGPVTLRFALPRMAPLRLSIYAATGRRVRDIATGAHNAGEHEVAWDLRDEAGRSVVGGIYFARLETAGHVLVRKIAVLK